jgi:hypothetical protein
MKKKRREWTCVKKGKWQKEKLNKTVAGSFQDYLPTEQFLLQ